MTVIWYLKMSSAITWTCPEMERSSRGHSGSSDREGRAVIGNCCYLQASSPKTRHSLTFTHCNLKGLRKEIRASSSSSTLEQGTHALHQQQSLADSSISTDWIQLTAPYKCDGLQCTLSRWIIMRRTPLWCMLVRECERRHVDISDVRIRKPK